MSENKGIDKIIERIEADAAAELATENTAFERQIAQMTEENHKRAEEIRKAGERLAEEAYQKELSRARAEAQSASRNILADAKSALVRRAFALAVRSLDTMEKENYLKIMAPMLKEAAAELSAGGAVLIVPAAHAVSGAELAEAAGVNVSEIRMSDAITAGFILESDALEIQCLPEKLADDRYEELAPRAAQVLFPAD